MGKLTTQAAQEMIDLYLNGEESDQLSVKYGVSKGTVINVVGGKINCYASCRRPHNVHEIIRSRKATLKGWYDDKHKLYPPLTSRQMEVITGSLLGDGHLTAITEKAPNSLFRKEQSAERFEYVDWHRTELQPFSKKTREVYSEEVFLGVKNGHSIRKKVDRYLAKYSIKTCCHPLFTELRNRWYPEGKKIVPRDIDLTPLTLSVWFCDDGSKESGGKHCRISTDSFLLNDVEFLQSKLVGIGIDSWLEHKVSQITGDSRYVIRISNRSYSTLMEIIVNEVSRWACMRYKIGLDE